MVSILGVLLIISFALNAVFFYLARNWEHKFEEPLEKNKLIDDNKVLVHVKRQFNDISVSVQAKGFNFNVNHNFMNDKEEKDEKKEETKEK